MEALQIFGTWDQKIDSDSRITNHEPLIPTLSFLLSENFLKYTDLNQNVYIFNDKLWKWKNLNNSLPLQMSWHH